VFQLHIDLDLEACRIIADPLEIPDSWHITTVAVFFYFLHRRFTCLMLGPSLVGSTPFSSCYVQANCLCVVVARWRVILVNIVIKVCGDLH
jgi:hypothetical protein